MILRHSAQAGRCLMILLALIAASCHLYGARAIGINYGTVANDLPSPAQVVQLLKTTSIEKVKLYEADPTILGAFAGSGYDIVVGVPNDQIQPIAASPSFAQQWVTANVAPFYPSTNIVLIAVGNEVLTTAQNVTTDLVPAMQNLQTGLANLGLSNGIKVTTPHSFAVLDVSYPPSAGIFQAVWADSVFTPLLAFLSQTGAPFMINAYPYFAYADNPTIDINYALFEQTAGVFDSNTRLFYSNLFDAQVDATYAALAKQGHQDIAVVVSESGWPSNGGPGEVGVSITNAQIYNSNLVKHVTSNAGTPGKPGVPVETYIFALFNENLKPGPFSEQNFGIFYPNEAPVYDIGIQTSPLPPVAPAGAPPSIPVAPAPFTQPPPPPAPFAQPPPPPFMEVPPPPPTPINTAPPPPYPVPQTPLFPTPSPPPPFGQPPPPPAPAFVLPSPPPPPTPAFILPSPPPPPAPAFILPSPPPPITAPPPPSFFSPPPGAGGVPPFFPSPPPPAPTLPMLPPPPPPTQPLLPLSPPPPPQVPASVAPVLPPPGIPPAPPGTPSGPNTWCISKPGSSISDLTNALNYACGEGEANCSPIQPSGPCYDPDTLFSHASYAFSSYYALNGRNYWNCFFGNVSLITVTDPSYGTCEYP